ncbi:MAG: AAA-like domain-containing protein, partial [Acidimicrobiales bacterium]
MPVSPFTYEYPVAPADVIDRDEESERLLELVTAGRFVRLLAPRRYGKTSLLGKVLAEADKQGIPTVLVDFYGVVSVAEVAHRIERAYAEQLHGKLRTLAERFLNASGFGVSLGAVGVSISLERTRNPDPLPALHTLLELPVQAL